MPELYEPVRLDAALKKELLEIWEAAFRASHSFLSDCAAAVRVKKPRVAEDLERLLLVCARQDGEIEGFAGIDGEELKMLYVRPDGQGKGIGRALVEHARQKHDIRYVDVYAQNEPAVVFYERMGFACYEKASKPDTNGTPLLVVRMKLNQT